MKKLCRNFLIITLSIFAGNIQAGIVTANKLSFIDYFNSQGWVATVQASSTAQWPNWLQYEGLVAFDDVIQSGLMLYACNDAVEGGCTITDPDVHRFIFSGPETPEYPDGDNSNPSAVTTVKVFDKIVSGQFRREWRF